MLTVDFKLFKINKGDRVLDCGCGNGRHTWEACKLVDCQVCGIDISDDDVKKTKIMTKHMDQTKEAKGWGEAMQGDALRLPFRDACFDKIICSEVLEHVKDDEQGVKELVRVLKEHGSIVVTVPTYLTETVYWKLDKDYHNHPGGHVRKYRANRLIDSLRRNSLKIYAVRFEHALHSIYWLLRCIFKLKNEDAFVPALYHKLLVHQIITKSKFMNMLENLCNFLFPKSIVIYARKVLR